MNDAPWIPPAFRLDPRLAGLGKSATLEINERSKAMLAEGRSVVSMGLGESPFPPPQAMREALARHAAEKTYQPVQGSPALREAVCSYLARTEGLQYEADQILVGPGSKELLFHLQMVCDAEVLLPSPSWVSYAPQARILGRSVQWLGSDPDTPDLSPETLARFCRQQDDKRPRLLILNYPNNPTGSTLDETQLRELALAARENSVLILSDEIYSNLHFAGEHQSIARYYPEGTIISNGISKWAGAGGWRLGVFAFPRSLTPILQTMVAVASESYTSVSAPVQYAAVEAFADTPEMDAYLHDCRRVVRSLMRWSWQTLKEAGARVCEPRGGFYLMLHLEHLRGRDGIQSGQELCRHLLETTGVATLPGSVFGRPPDELSLRLACVDFNGTGVLDAVAALPRDAEPDEAFLARHCQPTVDGIRALAAYL